MAGVDKDHIAEQQVEGQEEDLSSAIPEDDDPTDIDLGFLERKEQSDSETQPDAEQGPHSTDRTETAPAAPVGTAQGSPDPAAQSQPPPLAQSEQRADAPAQSQPPAPTEVDLEAGRRAAEAQDKAALDAMESSFALTEEDTQRLELEPGKIIPKLMARVMFESVKVAAQAVLAHMPMMIAQTQYQRDQSHEHERNFFEKWPQLKGIEGIDGMVVRQATLYRQLNPQAKVEDVIRDVGASITVALGQQIAASQAGLAQPGPGNGNRRASLPPINPAAASAPRSLPSGRQEENIYQGWASDDLME